MESVESAAARSDARQDAERAELRTPRPPELVRRGVGELVQVRHEPAQALLGRHRPQHPEAQGVACQTAPNGEDRTTADLELRKLVDIQRIELPYDRELLSEWQGQEIQYVRDEGSAAGLKTRYGGGSFHTLDAAKMCIAARSLQSIEEALNLKVERKPVLARFG